MWPSARFAEVASLGNRKVLAVMNLDRAIRGSLAALGDSLNEDAFIAQLAMHGLTLPDAHLAMEKAVLDGIVRADGPGTLRKLPTAFIHTGLDDLAPP